MRAALIATLLVSPVPSLAADADESPLIAYAQELAESGSRSQLKVTNIVIANLRAARRLIPGVDRIRPPEPR